jgi:hypothetical protein
MYTMDDYKKTMDNYKFVHVVKNTLSHVYAYFKK